MKKYWKWAVGAILVATALYAQNRVLSESINWDGIYRSTSANVITSPYPGQSWVTYDDTTQPELQVYDHVAGAWNEVPTKDDEETISADWTFNAARVKTVLREDFNMVSYRALENDDTAAVTTDGGVNYLKLLGSGELGIISYRLEAPGGPGLAATPAPGTTWGVFTADGYVDNVDNEGVQFTFGAMDNATTGALVGQGISFQETNSNPMYCEARIDIANISAVDDFWFGWALNDATDDPPASADFNTAALWTLSNTAGDIDFVTMLNDAAEGSDDAGTDWTDGDQFILRVDISADSVTFKSCLTDGCTNADIATNTATNATLNADDGDVLKCVLGFTNAAAESLGLTIDYIEIGEQ